jgi:hypothetical protein
MERIGSLELWVAFATVVVVMLLIDRFNIPVLFSLGVVTAIIFTSIVLSLRSEAHKRKAASGETSLPAAGG